MLIMTWNDPLIVKTVPLHSGRPYERNMSTHHQRRVVCLWSEEAGCLCERWLLRLCPTWCSDDRDLSSARRNATDRRSDLSLWRDTMNNKAHLHIYRASILGRMKLKRLTFFLKHCQSLWNLLLYYIIKPVKRNWMENTDLEKLCTVSHQTPDINKTFS